MSEPVTYPFSALLSRMKYIHRWGLMRAARSESLSEHVAETATIAHLLGLIATEQLGQTDVCPEHLAVAALYHDASEILTGDMPTPVKYRNEGLKNAYKQVERQSAETLAALAPPALQGKLGPLLTGEGLNETEQTLLKAADRLSALIKCLEEERSGNTDFCAAARQQQDRLKALHCPAANVFMEQMLPCYQKTLDELTGGI